MSYRTVLVAVDECKTLQPRVAAGARIARAHGASLLLTGSSGVARFIYETVASSPEVPDLDEYLESLRQRGRKALQRAEGWAREIGVPEIETRMVDEDAGRVISAWSAYCDLVVIGQSDRYDQSSTMDSGFPEYVVMHSGAPVLMIPCQASLNFPVGKALVAWNGRREAKRALNDSLPLLKQAREIYVACFNPETELPDLQGEQQLTILQNYFQAHGIAAEFLVRHCSGKVGEALLWLSRELGAELIIMGCYGHSRLRELVLGGTSRFLLRSSESAILTSH